MFFHSRKRPFTVLFFLTLMKVEIYKYITRNRTFALPMKKQPMYKVWEVYK